jgi:hypothetical protein
VQEQLAQVLLQLEQLAQVLLQLEQLAQVLLQFWLFTAVGAKISLYF